MRQPKRTPRAYSPRAVALEGRNPVSNLALMPGLLGESPAPNQPAERPARPVETRAAAPAQPTASRPASLRPRMAVVASSRLAAVATTAETVTGPKLQPTQVIADLAGPGPGPFASSVALLSPATNPGQPARVAPAAVAASTAPVGSPALSRPAASTTTASEDGIRPMTLAPVVTTSAAGQPTSDSAGAGAGFGAEAGSGSGGDPFLSNSASLVVRQTGDDADGRHYVVDRKIPVGAKVTVVLANPGNYKTITWSAGTDYADYFSGDPEGPAPTTMKVTKGVVTNQGSYTFIVDATPQEYKVKVSVIDNFDGTGKADLTFTSVLPKQATLSFTNTQNTLDWDGGVLLSRTVARFRASTGINNDGTDAGDFMFMQTASGGDSKTDGGGNTQKFAMIGAGPNIDNGVNDQGKPGDGPPIGATISVDDNYREFAHHWRLPYTYTDNLGQQHTLYSLQHTFGDNTSTHGDDTSVTLSANQSFSTYLMYRPSNPPGVWIALSRMNWTWNDSVSKVNGFWPASYSKPGPAPTGPTIPSGDEAFPNWTGRTWDWTWK